MKGMIKLTDSHGRLLLIRGTSSPSCAVSTGTKPTRHT